MTETKQKRKPRKYTDEFKQQLVDLYHSGKRRYDICREYDIAHSLFDKWVKQAENSDLSMKKTTAPRAGRTAKTPQGKPTAENGERHFKTGGADLRTKVNVIKANTHKYSVSAKNRICME